MVEGGIVPSAWLVTIVTLAAAAPLVNVVVLVATVAGRWRFQECMIGMAVKAGGLFMLADKAKPGRVMIECHFSPADR